MTIEEELIWLRKEQTVLRERLAQRDEMIQQQQTWLVEQNAVIHHHEEQMRSLSEQLKALQDQLGKDSHKSHLPPSSDRFVRKTKSLRTKSGKKLGGQPGHRGSSLQFSSTPNEITLQQVERCEACQHAACIVHLLRDLVFLAEEQGAMWAADLKELLLDMKQATDQAREQGKHWLDPLEVVDWEGRFLEHEGAANKVPPAICLIGCANTSRRSWPSCVGFASYSWWSSRPSL
jgi:uncharacterized coiled-coil protein SlyX